ncbi:hypothetical protein K431DRAFT_26107 [Polychaeton citri CBS 116435]|uniref:Uncharacterized protein n=1 Tax=Polychaeton citri CBS 116435 TaxID=1314669 RepID=A0A9P4Q0J9_9PEZI|nr:hypothetical protein K431DRAFT_26107 [Polychaeton citri CBS 116435]
MQVSFKIVRKVGLPFPSCLIFLRFPFLLVSSHSFHTKDCTSFVISLCFSPLSFPVSFREELVCSGRSPIGVSWYPSSTIRNACFPCQKHFRS